MKSALSTRLRQFIFWLHLATGAVAGSVIFVMSVTGVLLAFERQIVAFAERHTRTVQPPASDAPRLGLDALVSRARDAVTEGTPASVTLSAHPAAAVLISFGREQVVLVDPYTGGVLGAGATTLRGFFRVMTDWLAGLERMGKAVRLDVPSREHAMLSSSCSSSPATISGGRAVGRVSHSRPSPCPASRCAANRVIGTGTMSSASGLRRPCFSSC